MPSSPGIFRSVITVFTALRPHAPQRFVAVGGGDDVVAFAAQHRLEHAAHVQLVVGDEDPFDIESSSSSGHGGGSLPRSGTGGARRVAGGNGGGCFPTGGGGGNGGGVAGVRRGASRVASR